MPAWHGLGVWRPRQRTARFLSASARGPTRPRAETGTTETRRRCSDGKEGGTRCVSEVPAVLTPNSPRWVLRRTRRQPPPPPPPQGHPSPPPLRESQALQGPSGNPALGHPPTSCRDLHQQLDSGSGETSGPHLPAPNCLKHKAISCQRHLTPRPTPGCRRSELLTKVLYTRISGHSVAQRPPPRPAPKVHTGLCPWTPSRRYRTCLNTHLRSQEQGSDDDAVDEQDPIQQVAELGVQQAEALCLCAERWDWSARPRVTDTTPGWPHDWTRRP